MKRGIIITCTVLALIAVGFGAWKYFNRDPYIKKPLPELPVPPLRSLAKDRGIQLGNFAALKYLRERPYSEILSTEFEYVTLDGEPNWKFEDSTFRPARDKYDFSHIDQVLDFASQNNLPVRYQHLLWGDEKWLPDWLKDGNYSNQELLKIIDEHIATVTARYKGHIREYTVVNEAFSRELKKGGNEDWWGKKLGHAYIDQAFRDARAGDPNAILILNDFDNEKQNDVSDNMYNYIKDAKARGVPIDGIGMQMHISGDSPASRDEVAKNMRRFHDIGVKVYVTEFDVNMHGVAGSQDDKNKRQAEIYHDMLGACVDVGPDTCPNFGFLGLVDRQSWYKGIGVNDATPLMFTDDYQPKPAFFAVRDVLQNH